MLKRLVIMILLMALMLFNKKLFATATVIYNPNELPKVNSVEILQTRLNKINFKYIGSATFSVLFWDIYQSTLLSTSGKYPLKNQQEQLLFEIKYLKDISSEELVKHTEQQWKHIGIPVNSYQDYIPKLKRLWPDIMKGDTLSLVIKDQHSAFYFNKQYIGSITDATFGQHFIDIWLANNTSQPKLRKQLLGNILHD